MLLNCDIGEDSWLPWSARRSNQSILKEINPEYSLKDWCRSWSSTTLAPDAKSWPWCEELTDWKRSWCWERLKARRDGDDRGWDGWMASPTQWTWVWASSRRWWRTGKPGVLQSMGGKELDSTEWLNNMGLSCCMLDFSLHLHGLSCPEKMWGS